ncbi:hypothetical protein TBLA_0A10240 [Henningerozyma blattae CBS 6284]|uniref:Phosphatidic acid phosphatase type 2/haloperoxidase domain-containing protein n=1 Tax=Henningerozyma blattae (strain ATCC 34711 / CBS 6284 / DSM 70876 / NBRC 10599 / NRRL Y-10934 / UCD 77-7) TaxID=1071380 RepID=I2GXF1_HENB6|nr:hypothetical protein TBLA_0A10240 [Tetrapisispora blattae CBS 6284]CCH58803.1 hypothetical protein TBLA_0A10240 [Tetrapisispora blattae CBS 6284]
MPLNRLSLNLPEYGIFGNTSNQKKWMVSDLIILVVIVILNYPVYYQEPFERQFYINDLTISHPYAEHQRVGNLALLLYSYVLPVIVIILIVLIFADSRHRTYLLYVSLLGLTMSFTLNTLFTNYIKNWIGRSRPDFLARCIPKGGLEKDVLYTASEVCTTTDREKLLEGFRTTPSGHSSESFSGLGFLYLWLCGQLLTQNPSVGIWRKITAMLPLLGATLIALSRTEDYRHHFVDVIIGSALGYFFAYNIYLRYFPSIDSEIPFKPLLDDSEVDFRLEQEHVRIPDEEELAD